MSARRVRFHPEVEEVSRPPEHALPTSPVPSIEPASLPVISSTLRPNECAGLDFSLPSAAFQYHVDEVLDAEALDEPACSPPLQIINIRVAAPHASPDAPALITIAVVHEGRELPVTVGDILSQVHRNLRQPLENMDMITSEEDIAAVRKFHGKRLSTLCERCVMLEAHTRDDVLDKEEALGPRRVDLLQGNVLFAGLTARSDMGVHQLQLHLDFSDRYIMDKE